MDFSEKLIRILDLEKLNLKEFSELAGIHYQTAKQYKGGHRSPSYEKIQKILSVPRFSQYKNLLLSPNEQATNEMANNENFRFDFLCKEIDAPYETPDTTQKAAELFRRLEALGRGDEALAILEAIEASAKKK